MPSLLKAAPRLADTQDHPAVQAAQEKINNNQARMREIDQQDQALQVDEQRSHNMEERAKALTAGKPLDRIAIRQQRQQLHDEYETRRHAEKTLQADLRDAIGLASKQICTERLPEHKKLGRRIVAALEELAEALEAESDFRDQLQRDGATFREPMQTMSFQNLGDPKQPESMIRILLRERQDY